jgi:hypothetical protein
VSYSDTYKDMQQAEFLNKWTPDGIGPLKPNEENLRWNLAKRRAAEAELSEIKHALHVLRAAVG